MEDIPVPVALPRTTITRDRPSEAEDDMDPLPPVPGLNNRYNDDNNARGDASSLLIGVGDDDELDNGNDDDADDEEHMPVGRGVSMLGSDANDPYAGLGGAFGTSGSNGARPSSSSQGGKQQDDLLL